MLHDLVKNPVPDLKTMLSFMSNLYVQSLRPVGRLACYVPWEWYHFPIVLCDVELRMQCWLPAGTPENGSTIQVRLYRHPDEADRKGKAALARFWASAHRYSHALGKIILQSANFEIACEIGADSLRCSNRPSERRIIGHFMQESCPAQRSRIGQGLRAFGGVKHELDVTILDQVDDMGPAL